MMVLLKEYFLKNYVYVSGGGRYVHMCASAQGCQKVVSDPWSWPYRRRKASQQDAENIILILWKSRKCSSTLNHHCSQTNFSHFKGNREARILVSVKIKRFTEHTYIMAV